MGPTCPHCLRELASSGTGEPAVFCMFCGQRLTSSHAGDSGVELTHTLRASTEDSGRTPRGPDSADVITRTFMPSDTSPTPEPGRVPTLIGGYRLEKLLGTGGMGAVYEATSSDNGTRVAVKLLTGKLTDNAVSVERFKLEGRVASQIAHPHCVFVLGADTDDGQPFIVMELMPGTTLKDLVEASGPLAPGAAIARILDVIAGLAEAHRLGVIHRDVKPSNCFLTADDRVKVGDFGLSKSLATEREDAQLTRSGAFLGTVLFASPEQIRGESVSYDSDVYSVCATLYFLLTGQAPHMHTSLTGALAKAISGPPRPARAICPAVPAALDRVLLCGLERDRDRRWQSLDDLRDALRDQLPTTHSPARLRSLILAYVIDVVLLQFIDVPLEFLAGAVNLFALDGITILVAMFYFGIAEGCFGTTLGKRLMRLRVTRLGEIRPPGLKLAVARTAVFHLIFLGTLTAFAGVVEWNSSALVRMAGGLGMALGLAGLFVQAQRTAAGYRGLHDRLTGCQTLQRPRPAHRVRLISRHPNPLDRICPTTEPLPATVGGFSVRNKLANLPDNGEVWIAEDRSLGRRVLVRVSPSPVVCADPSRNRPGRLRVIGHGRLTDSRAWAAYVAPAAAPLLDVADPKHLLGWADARLLVEQLVEELESGADGAGTDIPSIAQVWVEPGGRLQLLDFPLPTGSTQPSTTPPEDALGLVREVTTLALEGRPRSKGGRIRAAVPPHAAEVTTRLFTNPPRGYPDLTELRNDLAQTHHHPPEVTGAIRAAHLGIQAAMLAAGVVVMFAVAGLFSWVLAVTAGYQTWLPEAVRTTVADPDKRAAFLAAVREAEPPESRTRRTLEAALAPSRVGETLGHLDQHLGPLRANLEAHRLRLNTQEKAMLDRVGRLLTDAEETQRLSPDFRRMAAELIDSQYDPRPSRDIRWGVVLLAAGLVVAVPLVWAAFAFVFHGGLSYLLAGLTIVRADGVPASRFRCALRELVVWLPLTAVLLSGLWMQAAAPEMVFARTALWLVAAALLPLYAVVAMRSPSRPPQDRLMGTYLVPV